MLRIPLHRINKTFPIFVLLIFKTYTMRLFIALPFLFVISTSALGQTQGQAFDAIDQHAKNAPAAATRSVEKLAEYLNQYTQTDLEKVRSYYTWLTHHIAYDTKSFFSGKSTPETSADATLKSRKAICQGYSELFKALCDYSSIPCYIVSGYSKGYGYREGKKFTESDHAWNVVLVDQEWQLIDATWGAGHVDDKQKFINEPTYEFFLTAPAKFVLKHLPSDPMWQLLPCPISLDDYSKDDAAITAKINSSEPCFNYKDTLAAYQRLNRVEQMINSADRAYRFNPTNVEAPGFAYLNMAYEMGSELKKYYDEKDYKKALELNQTLLLINQKAYGYLKQSKSDQGKNAAGICKQNINSLKTNIKSLEQFLK